MTVIEIEPGKYRINFNNVSVELTKQEVAKLRHLCYSALNDHVVCRCCGIGNLKWRQVDEKWLLFDGNILHDCPVKPLYTESDDTCDWV